MIFTSDLDRTLIYSVRSMGEIQSPIRCVEKKAGREASYMSERAITLLNEVVTNLTFIPNTTRTLMEYQRIDFFQQLAPTFAVTNNGAVILYKGNELTEWTAIVKERTEQTSIAKELVRQRFMEIASADWIIRYGDAGNFLYALIRLDKRPIHVLNDFQTWLKQNGWCMFLQGRKIYFMPACISKWQAIAFLQAYCNQKAYFSAGDGRLDLPMLAKTPLAFVPRHNTIEQLLPHMIITEKTGIHAAEDILMRVLQLSKEKIGV